MIFVIHSTPFTLIYYHLKSLNSIRVYYSCTFPSFRFLLLGTNLCSIDDKFWCVTNLPSFYDLFSHGTGPWMVDWAGLSLLCVCNCFMSRFLFTIVRHIYTSSRENGLLHDCQDFTCVFRMVPLLIAFYACSTLQSDTPIDSCNYCQALKSRWKVLMPFRFSVFSCPQMARWKLLMFYYLLHYTRVYLELAIDFWLNQNCLMKIIH